MGNGTAAVPPRSLAGATHYAGSGSGTLNLCARVTGYGVGNQPQRHGRDRHGERAGAHAGGAGGDDDDDDEDDKDEGLDAAIKRLMLVTDPTTMYSHGPDAAGAIA